MKKTLFKALLAVAISLVAISSQATLFWSDTVTNYPLGCITTNNTVGFTSPQWISHLPGSGVDAIVTSNFFGNAGVAINGRRLSIFQGGAEYIHRWFDPVATNGFGSGNGTILYASFVVTVNLLPTQGGTYFAHFMDDQFEFRGRIFAVANTNVFPFTTTVSNTFRIGIANAANDTAQGQGPTAIIPLDLAINTDYQIVLRYDIDNGLATAWINPSSESDTTSTAGPITDVGSITNDLKAFAFRQRVNAGRELIRNVMVGTSFADVMTNTPSLPLIGIEPANITNYSGNAGLLEVAASGIGLNYQWYQVVLGITNAVSGGTGPQLVFSDLEAVNAGQYFCTISNTSSSTNTTVVNVVINSTPTPPTFTIQPASAAVSLGANTTLNSSAFGTGPLTFQWSFNGTPIPNDGPNPLGFAGDNIVISGSQTPTLTLTGVSTNEAGAFTITVTGGLGVSTTSTNAVLTVKPVQQVSIAFLRSLENLSTFQPTDTADIFAVTGVVTMFTNVTSGTTASYYIQDGTAGIDLFVTGDASFRPHLGDIVAASGTLSSFNNALELAVNSLNPYQTYAIVGHTNLLPAPVVFDLQTTNNVANMETNYEGRLVMLTNVSFAGTLSIGTGNTTLIATNASGYPIQVFFPAGVDKDVASKTLGSRFAYTVTGVMAQFLSGTQGTKAGYEVYVTSLGDILTNPPPAVTSTATIAGSDVGVSWLAVPYAIATNSAGFTQSSGAYSYSVYGATNVAGPYLPIATGLTFNTPFGGYTVTNANAPAMFYKVVSP